MRKLTLVGVLVALGWAAQAQAQSSTQEETREAGQAAKEDVNRAGQNTKEWSGEQKNKAAESMNKAGDHAHDTMAQGKDKKHPLFEGKNNFDLEGKVSKATATSITVTREDLPPATLSIDRNTKIELDGERASAAMLKPGQEVKASFNLQGAKPMAVEVKAEKK